MEAVDASTTATAYLAVQAGSNGFLGGARLCAAAAAATAVLQEINGSGRILAKLGAAIGEADEFFPPEAVRYVGAVFVTITGAGAVLNLYQR
jgi:hypothetical protein